MSTPYVGQLVQFNLATPMGPNGATLGFGGVTFVSPTTGKVWARGFADQVIAPQWVNNVTWQATPVPGANLVVCWPANPAEQS